jgi:hypothetical protein
MGMKRPAEAYFPTVKLFDDLPVITPQTNKVKNKFLALLGVRKTIELSVIFERLMMSPTSVGRGGDYQGKWDHVDLIKYLASVQNDIPVDDIERLKQTPICGAEPGPGLVWNTRLYCVKELFKPTKALRELNLPVLQWHGLYTQGSPEGRFLLRLGLQTHPSVEELLSLMASPAETGNTALGELAMRYFIENHVTNQYNNIDLSAIQIPILPVENSDPRFLAAPSACFTNNKASLLDFHILRTDLHSHAAKFGVSANPLMRDCVDRIVAGPPKSLGEARDIFSYLNSRDIDQTMIELLSKTPFIPIFAHTLSSEIATRFVAPKNCFLGHSPTYGKIFDFVDFGVEANLFLLKCGSKYEPTKFEIAWKLVREPATLLSILGTTEKYLALLKSLAVEYLDLKNDKALLGAMKCKPFLLAYKTTASQNSPKCEPTPKLAEDGHDGYCGNGEIQQFELASSEQIFINDDERSYNLFKNEILAAPQNDILEEFYSQLGVRDLSSIVVEEPRIGRTAGCQSSAKRLRATIMERVKLFFHVTPLGQFWHDTRWLETNLSVSVTANLHLRRSLRGFRSTHTETKTALGKYNRNKTQWCLWVTTSGFDMFEVSEALTRLLLRRPKPHSAMMLEQFLTWDLYKLKARGFNVDRILQTKQEQRLSEEKRRKQFEEEQRQLNEQEKHRHDSQFSGMGPNDSELQQSLSSAIQASRAHNSSSLFSRPTQKTVKDLDFYCHMDFNPSHDLSFLSLATNSVQIFISRTIETDTSSFLAQNSAFLNTFAVLLVKVGQVYALPTHALHIFYDAYGSTIAFNYQGSIFCNFRYFKQLHLPTLQKSYQEGRTLFMPFWFVTLAHEIAHNLVNDHSSQHSYYT